MSGRRKMFEREKQWLGEELYGTGHKRRKRTPDEEVGGLFEYLIEAAIAHGEAEKDLTFEGSDLAEVLREAWMLMTPRQRYALLNTDAAKEVIEHLGTPEGNF